LSHVSRRSRPWTIPFALALAAATAVAGSGDPPVPPAPPAPAAPGGGDPAKPAAPAKVSLDRFLKGNVVALDDSGKVEVRYDFSVPGHADDFALHRPFRVQGPFEHGPKGAAFWMKGTGGYAWKVLLRKRLSMDFDARVRPARDAGAYIVEERDTENYTLFSIFDQYFQNKDSPGSPKQHMICRFLPGSREFNGDLVFRYVCRGTQPRVQPDKAFPVKLGRDGVDEWMEIDGAKMQGNENQWTPLRGLRPGFYVIDSEIWISGLVIRGEIDPKWAEEVGVDLALPAVAKAPATVTKEPGPLDIAAKATLDAYRTGAATAREVLKVVEDGQLLDGTREAAAALLKAGGDMGVVPRAVPLMESADARTRALAGELVQGLCGRSFGFKPDDPEDKRRKAVQSVLKYIHDNPSKFP
jgi:hypothetical protein